MNSFTATVTRAFHVPHFIKRRRLISVVVVSLALVYLITLLCVYTLPKTTVNFKDIGAYFGKGDEDREPSDSNQLSLALKRLTSGDRIFNWNDWLDLSTAETFEKGELDFPKFPYASLTDLNSMKFPYDVTANHEEQALVGVLYCKYRMPAPRRVTLLGSPKDAVVGEGTYANFDVLDKDPQRYHQQYKMEYNPLYPHQGPPIVADLNKTIEDRLQVNVEETLFRWNALDILQEKDLPEDLEFERQILEQSLNDVGNSEKFFHEVKIKNDPLGYGTHYDWRFFRGLHLDSEHAHDIHQMLRVWGQFADTVGLSYWIAHGSLIGWYWNGMTMPWDSDNDIQMPIMELKRLAQEFNGTLVVQRPEDGGRKYFIEVSPWYVQRVKGNGRNVIDARFIDVDTGAYIDITGLAFTTQQNEVNCKNYHFYEIDDITPLRRTQYEGYPTYVPNRVTKLLRKEYSSFDDPKFQKWFFNDQMQLWITHQTCEDYKKRFNQQANIMCSPTRMLDPGSCNNSTMGTCNLDFLELYQKTKFMTGFHTQETSAWESFTDPMDEDERKESEFTLKTILTTYVPTLS